MTIYYLSATDFARRAGLAVETIRRYMQRGLIPPPDAIIGLDDVNGRPIPGWTEDTVAHWMSHRLGRGHRSDLKK